MLDVISVLDIRDGKVGRKVHNKNVKENKYLPLSLQKSLPVVGISLAIPEHVVVGERLGKVDDAGKVFFCTKKESQKSLLKSQIFPAFLNNFKWFRFESTKISLETALTVEMCKILLLYGTRITINRPKRLKLDIGNIHGFKCTICSHLI